ncbi:hypothetical protein BUALT_Bualt16G0108500 [Buddleja alternifolia]|uniref:FAR1 domain-containing protein n=1 Tax=Buddleja alternifolia TaxID=168488 RepID=A0AAV6WH96_9LAMI|nr:hypothetical protein BUALT_Bualt16G0108500 [Buddleja alternifolia]
MNPFGKSEKFSTIDLPNTRRRKEDGKGNPPIVSNRRKTQKISRPLSQLSAQEIYQFLPESPAKLYLAQLQSPATYARITGLTLTMDNDTSIHDLTPRRKLAFEFDEEKELLGNGGSERLINKRHSTISEEKIPKIGMEFDDEKATYTFYNEYPKVVGFSVRKHALRRDNQGTIIDRIFCCVCQGHRQKDKRDVNVKSHRPETRNGCLAMMRINGRNTGKYKVVSFVASHNGHDLVSPTKTHFLRSHRRVTAALALQADDLDSSGIAPRAGFALMAKQVGGREKVGFIFEDYKNYLRSKRTVEMKIGDTGGVLEYLQQRQLDDPNFFYAIQVDEDDLITNILWADAQMMADYAHFGDVVSFDTTYRKNK